jgi:Fructose-1,6-bisphosphatase/sedoheptulose 1,7-bisphosphatase and related proteins
MANDVKLDRNLALEVVRVTEAAALAASKLMGRGDEKKADQAAVDAMRTTLNSLAIEGTVVIGEGERDEARCSTSASRSARAGVPRWT